MTQSARTPDSGDASSAAPTHMSVNVTWLCDKPPSTNTNADVVRADAVIIDTDDAPWAELHTWCVDRIDGRLTAFSVDHYYPDEPMFLARLVLGLSDTDPLQAVHLGGDWFDCRKRMLVAAPSVTASAARNNTSGYKGVSIYKPTGTWRAMIYSNNRQKTIGYYKTAEAAHLARLAYMQRPLLTGAQA